MTMHIDQMSPASRRRAFRLVRNTEQIQFGVPAWLVVVFCFLTAVLCTVSFALIVLVYTTR